MTPFTLFSGTAALIAIDNIDTDQLIPARFMKRPRSEGYGAFLLHDLRQILFARALIGEDDVQHLLGGAGFGNAVEQLRLGGPRPGPGADLAQAALIDVDDEEAAFVLVLGDQAPDDVAGALFKPGEPARRDRELDQPGRAGQQQGKADNPARRQQLPQT